MNKSKILKKSLEKYCEEGCYDTSNLPNKLYKYRGFDEYTLEMIEENYLYLSSAEELDDQFDCTFGFDKEKILNTSSSNVIKYYLKYVKNHLKTVVAKKTVKTIENIIDYVDEDGVIKADEFSNYLIKKGSMLDKKELKEKINLLNSKNRELLINEQFKKYFEDLLNDLESMKKDIGICSLSEKKDSQIMWQMYAENYKGYCVEYDIDEIIKCHSNSICLLPVIYTNKNNVEPIKFMINYIMDISIFPDKIDLLNRKAFVNLCNVFVTKNKEWELQSEWRIIGDSNSKMFIPKIKRIYLGKNVSPINKRVMIELAKKEGFDLLLQYDDFEHLSLKFKKIDINMEI